MGIIKTGIVAPLVEILTLEDVAEVLRVDRQTIYRFAKKIPMVLIGCRKRIREDSLHKWIEAKCLENTR